MTKRSFSEQGLTPEAEKTAHVLEYGMTYLIIGRDKQQQVDKVLEMVSAFFQKEVTDRDMLPTFPDIHILDGREQNSLGIEEVKNFQSAMVYKPFEEDVQFGIIWQSEKLTHQAQNSLLKTLEESEDHTIFLLCVNNEKSLLQTIISRSKPMYLNGIIEQEEIVKPDILEKDLAEQFKEIENIGKDKTQAIELVNQIEKYYKHFLSESIKENDIDKSISNKEILKLTADARNKLNANCNKRLVLESLVLHIKSS